MVRFKPAWFAAFALVVSLAGCERGSSGDDATSDTGVEADASPADAGTADPGSGGADATADVAPPPPPARLVPPLKEVPSAPESVLKSLPDEPVGTLSGKIFGEKRRLRAISRVSCGEGTVLQAIYDHGPQTSLRITPAIPLQFFGLATGKPVSYEDRGFEVKVDFEEDSADRLAGRLVVNYTDKDETYVDIEMDAEPLATTFEPKLDGDGELPLYTNCTPTGYFLAVDETRGEDLRGLVHAVNVGGRGAPVMTIPFTEQDVLNVMIIPPKPDTEFDEEQTVALEGARERGNRPASVLADAFHTPEIAPPGEALGRNVGDHQKAMILSGKIKFRLWKDDERWHVEATLNDITVPELLSGPLKGRKFSEIRVSSVLADKTEMGPPLPEPPAWWAPGESGDEEASDE